MSLSIKKVSIAGFTQNGITQPRNGLKALRAGPSTLLALLAGSG
jgi:hypothetical protein